jgi:hypothetical protein
LLGPEQGDNAFLNNIGDELIPGCMTSHTKKKDGTLEVNFHFLIKYYIRFILFYPT